jgi:hypothetical protein
MVRRALLNVLGSSLSLQRLSATFNAKHAGPPSTGPKMFASIPTAAGYRPVSGPPSLRVTDKTNHLVAVAAAMDRQADAELFLGRYLRAEYLAHRAAALRAATP